MIRRSGWQFTGESARKRECVALASECQAKSQLTAGQETRLEQNYLSFLVIGPGSHLGHYSAQVGALAANLDNVHERNTPAERVKYG